MKIRLEIDGTEQEVDLDLGSLTLREAVDVQRTIGDDKWDELAAGSPNGIRPDVIQALIYAKLHTKNPELDVSGFDFDMRNIDPDSFEPDPT